MITHRDQGEGPPLLLLNGVMMTLSAWDGLVRALGPGYRVVRCDFRGQLLTPAAPHRALEDNARDLVELLDRLGIGRVHLAGTSFGAAVALAFAARFPDRVNTLALIAGGAGLGAPARERTERWRRAARDVARGGERRELFDLLAADIYSRGYAEREAPAIENRRRQFARLPAAWFDRLAALLDTTSRADLSALPSHVRARCLVVGTEHDGLVPPADCERLARTIPGATFRLLPDAGHAVVLEKPRETAGLLREFLAARG
ncbi:MAG: alpha/beta fold hydrolase [Acidobacteria bacterium]|nr:alpha/beta fold hydrolase [Acidobacteriota bacterium]